MKFLITGFDPFGGESINPAYEAVKKLPDQIGSCEIIKQEIPTVFGKAGQVLEEAILKTRPDYVLCVGQAGGRAGLSVEKVAINYRDGRIPDNAGVQPIDTPIRKDGPAAYFASVPVKAMTAGIRAAGIPAYVSYSAGTYVCNDIMYTLLDLIDRKYPEIKGGFIHVPYATAQGIDKPAGTPTMSLENMVEGLTAAIQAAIDYSEADLRVPMGTTH